MQKANPLGLDVHLGVEDGLLVLWLPDRAESHLHRHFGGLCQVFVDGIEADSFLRIWGEDLAEDVLKKRVFLEVFQLVAVFLYTLRELEPFLQFTIKLFSDFLVSLSLYLKRIKSCNHKEQNNPTRPCINFRTVPILRDLLRRNERTTEDCKQFLAFLHDQPLREIIEV